ncbi:MAG: SGNH/GDSL hydrolase family protein [Chitinophagales bacterium]|nr:SGNH/GDSL hydrolase family protein [Chitinophagales bacterium]
MEILLRVNGNFYTYSEKTEGKYVSYYNARIKSPYHVYGPHELRNLNRSEFNYSYKTNSLGLREKELSLEKPDSACRILFLGDSFTEGIGTPNDSTYPALFGQFLQQAHNRHVDVINAGISGSDPFYCFRLYQDKLVDFRPDPVVLAINSSDITDYIFRGGMERFQPDGSVRFRKGPWWELPYRFCHFVRWIVHEQMQYDRTFMKEENSEKIDQEAREAIVQCLDDFNKLCKMHGANFIAVLHPTPVEFKGSFSNKNNIRPIASALDSLAIMNIVLYEQLGKFFNKENIEQYYWTNDGHYNSKGYAVFAKSVAESIEVKYPLSFERMTRCN